MRPITAIVLFALLAPAGAAAATSDVFPRPPELEPAVDFWTRIYSQVSTDGGLLHDRDDLAIVYEHVDLPDGLNRRQRSAHVRERKKHYRRVLLDIAGSERSDLGPEARRILSLWPDGVSDARLERAAYNIRFQLGQADKFRAGLVRSGAWEPHIRRTLQRMGLPEELAALPHVESSFNPDAWSRVGAAGLWQFTRSTGRRYMRIDHVVDERMDPFRSTIAAARLLEHNYSVTGSWALALTAYNHGLAGIRRAVRKVGTSNIATIARRYDSRTWGFASRNFYAAFLAAVEVDFHAERYFGDVRRREAIASETVELPFYASVDALADAFEVDRGRLHELNRALRDPIWEGLKRVPRGYELRVPSGPDRAPAQELLARVADGARYYAQVPDRYHRVRRGEALSTIARRYGVSTRELVALNNLPSRNFIRAGQTLRLPVPAATPRPAPAPAMAPTPCAAATRSRASPGASTSASAASPRPTASTTSTASIRDRSCVSTDGPHPTRTPWSPTRAAARRRTRRPGRPWWRSPPAAVDPFRVTRPPGSRAPPARRTRTRRRRAGRQTPRPRTRRPRPRWARSTPRPPRPATRARPRRSAWS
ncbi:MAG: transglycosylase SLT domain-containing protein [Halofilum sp. (in: g-proteobacteria)]|nr:transglycosylase SLT domain-containing protein [Halofilum sp. (in: g-proteobacteria)]